MAMPVQAMPWDRPEKMVVALMGADGAPLIVYFTTNQDVVVHDGHITITPEDGRGHHLKTLDLFGNLIVLHDVDYQGPARIESRLGMN